MRLHFPGLATTRSACPEEGVREAAFLNALQSTVTWNIQDENPELRDEQGVFLARFEALYLR